MPKQTIANRRVAVAVAIGIAGHVEGGVEGVARRVEGRGKWAAAGGAARWVTQSSDPPIVWSIKECFIFMHRLRFNCCGSRLSRLRDDVGRHCTVERDYKTIRHWKRRLGIAYLFLNSRLSLHSISTFHAS